MIYTKKINPNPNEKFIIKLLKVNEIIPYQECQPILGQHQLIQPINISGRFIRIYFKKYLKP
jgi:hypothetical protein